MDQEDYDDLSQFQWVANKFHRTIYATRGVEQRQELMHRRILGLFVNDGVCTHHINGNSLDNRRFNLQKCNSRSEHGQLHKGKPGQKRNR